LRKSETAWNWVPEWLPTHAQEKSGLRHVGPVVMALNPGIHTLTIVKRKRERPLIDKVVLTIAGAPPEGFGPSASATIFR
jgi:hypothetical protein